MKTIYSLILLALCTQLAKATNEVPNPSFENWTAGTPVSWYTSNTTLYGNPVTQTATTHSGSSAARGQAVFSGTLNDTITAALFSGTPGGKFPITQNYGSLQFYYQSSFTGGDILSVVVVLYAGASYVGSGSLDFTANASGWTQGSVPINIASGTADGAYITFTLAPPGTDGRTKPNPSSWFIIDDVSLGAALGLKDAHQQDMISAYPVPAHDWLTVKTADRSKPATLLLVDATGRTVTEKNVTAGVMNYELDLQGIVPGIYSLLIVTDEKSLMRRIVVQ